MPLLEVSQLSKRFGETLALDRLDLSVGQGEIVCLLGGNGAGKTTALLLILGLLAPDGGHAEVCGRNIVADPAGARAKLGYLPEIVALYPLLTGVETLAYFDDLAGRASSRAERTELLERVGLPAQAQTRRVATYSKGMRQKLGIAIALSKGAEVLLLDEPLSGLDPHAANELVILLRSLADAGKSVLMVTHDIFRAQQIADRIGVMRMGRLVETIDARKATVADIEKIYADHLRDVA